MVNKYPGKCAACKSTVPAGGGKAIKSQRGRWYVVHLVCEDGTGKVNTIEIGGNSYIRNARGRCEDAPCCGCCTI